MTANKTMSDHAWNSATVTIKSKLTALLEHLGQKAPQSYSLFHKRVGLFCLGITLFLLFGLCFDIASMKKGDLVYYFAWSFSFLHYLFYIFQYLFRRVPQRKFIRDAEYFKVIGLVLLFCVYVYHYQGINAFSLVVVLFGGVTCFYAYKVLGERTTYYGRELGTVKHRNMVIKSFPYNLSSHPMILGAIIALIGSLLNPDFCRHWWPIVVTHILFYLVVLLQEIYVVEAPSDMQFESIYTKFNALIDQGVTIRLLQYAEVIIGYFAIIGLLGVIITLCGLHVSLLFAISLIYLVFLFYAVPMEVAIVMFLISFLCIVITHILVAPLYAYIVLLLAAIVLQMLVYRLTKGKTAAATATGKRVRILKYGLSQLFLPALLVYRCLT